MIFKFKENNEIFGTSLLCKVKKMGNRFAQELYFLEPTEDKTNVKNKLSRRINFSKDQQQILEGEYVLLKHDKFEFIGFVIDQYSLGWCIGSSYCKSHWQIT